MNQALGKVVTAVMIDENDQDYFVQPDRNGQTYRLPKDEAPQVLHIGGSVSGFVYEPAPAPDDVSTHPNRCRRSL